MSYNPNFYNNIRRNNSTFQHSPNYLVPSVPPPRFPPNFIPGQLPPNFAPAQAPPNLLPQPPSHYDTPPTSYTCQPPQFSKPPTSHLFVPPPPQPPTFFIPSATTAAKREEADQAFLSTFESKIPAKDLTKLNVKWHTISGVREEIYKMMVGMSEMYDEEKHLRENIGTLTEEEWNTHIKQAEKTKAAIVKLLTLVNGPCMDMQRKLLAKRSAKRSRLKRLRLEKKKEKEERIKELKERSRKIDENLQKIKDDIIKAKQEAEEKLQADMVLKEVLRKKTDANKCLAKLDAVMKLRKARQNSAIGRGETVSDAESTAFNSHIEKLKSLWSRKLILYEKEEADLRAQLKEDSQLNSLQAKTEQQVASNLEEWKATLFGGSLPQVDFGGDVERFVAVRSQWDSYISTEGTALPIGWVPPAPKTDDG